VKRRSAFLGATLMLVGCATPRTTTDADNCYDALVRAKAIAQIPTPLPQLDDPNRIIFAWPWFVDLEISRVLEGTVDGKVVKALAVLHSSWVSDEMTFALRRTTVGNFNILRGDPKNLRRCDRSVPAEVPYIDPAKGQTLDDLRRESEIEYQRYIDGFSDEDENE